MEERSKNSFRFVSPSFRVFLKIRIFSVHIRTLIFERFIKPGGVNAVNYTRFGKGARGGGARGGKKKKGEEETERRRHERGFQRRKSKRVRVDVEIRKFACFSFPHTIAFPVKSTLFKPTYLGSTRFAWNNSIARIQNTLKTRGLITNYPTQHTYLLARLANIFMNLIPEL